MALNCNKSVSICKNYMLLKPEDVHLLDLICILFLSDIEKRKFVDCPRGAHKEPFERRWLIFVSILAQKVLLAVSTPLRWFGEKLEKWLNLLSSNGNILKLVWNFLHVKVVWPDKSSATFLSVNGHLDDRVELEKNIKHGDSRYYGAFSVMAAKISYENKDYIKKTVVDHWKMDFLGFYDFWNEYQNKATTKAFMLRDQNVDPELIVVAFRGTEFFDADAWCTDFDISWYDIPGTGKVHSGFMKALGLQKDSSFPEKIEKTDDQHATAYYSIREMLKKFLQTNEKSKFIVTGHSLGGALAILFAAMLALHKEKELLERLEGVYTFGQPRVGDERFGDFMEGQLGNYSIPYYRFVYSNDIVPRLPYDDSTLMFKHFGTCLYYNSFYEGNVVKEEPNKNYFSPSAAIPKIINAFWELIRSFIIPYIEGPDYKEGFYLRVLRLIGLVIPGLPAHSNHDYVNCTRLESSDLNIYQPKRSSRTESYSA